MEFNTKKFISAALAALTILNTAAFASATTVEEPVELELLYLESDEPSEFGYISSRYVDESGNEIVFEESEETPITCYSLNDNSIPSSFDAREEGIIAPVKSQGSTNNCWAFSTIGALESDSIVNGFTEKENTDFSEAHLAWFAHRPNTSGAADGADGDGVNYSSPYYTGGNWRIATAALARHSGIAEESSFPFGSISSMGNYDESERFNMDSGLIIDSAQELSVSDVKNWVAEHGVVCASFHYADKYYSNSDSSYFCNAEEKVNHQINIIGWDDSYPAENFLHNPNKDGAWLCQNSWGTNFGENGYFWISYHDTTISEFVGYTARSAEGIHNNYTHNGAGWSVSVSTGSVELAAANVFVSKGYEKLSSVSTYTVNPGTFVKVNIYKNLSENYTNPSDGDLVASFDKLLENSGYHTLDVDSDIFLEPDEIFSVAVYYYSYNGRAYVPVERSSSNIPYHSDSGESYLLFNTSANYWKTTQYYGFENAVIQATTTCLHPHTESKVTDEATCNKEGTLSDICTQCGEATGTKCISMTEHNYGEWSDYIHNSDNNTEISTRECLDCGYVQRKSYNSGNTIRLDEFLELFFSKFFEIFKLIR